MFRGAPIVSRSIHSSAPGTPLRMRRLLTLFACIVLGRIVDASNPASYKVDWMPSGQRAVDSVLKATSQLETLRSTAPVDPYGLLARARGDVTRLQTVLRSFGYYQGAITITINGMDLDSPTLGDALSGLPKGTDAHVKVSAKLGPLFHIGRIEIEGQLPAGMERKLGLAPGDPAVATEVLAASANLQSALQNAGYAFAKMQGPAAKEDPAQHILNLRYRVSTGPRVHIGEIRIEGLKLVHESLVRRRLPLRTGQLFSAANVEKARKDLLSLGVFSQVSVRLGDAPDHEQRVPITFVLQEGKRFTTGVSAAYSTDLGASAGLSWSDLDVFGSAQQLSFSATAINLGGSASTGLGYDAKLGYSIPDFHQPDQTLSYSLGAIHQALEAYTQTAETASSVLSRKLSSLWTVSAGVAYEHEIIEQEGLGYRYDLLLLPLTASYDSTDLASPLLDPTHGYRLSLNLSPTFSYGKSGQTFLISQVSLATYFDLHRLFEADAPGRTVLAAKVMTGNAAGATQFSLPPDQRFYAGGSGTVRGYRYQSVGPQFPDGNPQGGTNMQAINLELRQRVGTNLGLVVFTDSGGVSSPSGSVYRVGLGTGVRYYTSIGPIRFDIAVPTERRPNDDKFEVYIGLGQAF
jgi:translocation and assembly module TamA